LPDSKSFELHQKTGGTIPYKFLAHKDESKTSWLKEIRQYATDLIALQEHALDDLRIDPNQVQSDNEASILKLPHRIEASAPDKLIKPSDIAPDYTVCKNKLAIAEKKPAQAVEEQAKSTNVKAEEPPAKVVKVEAPKSQLPVKTPEVKPAEQQAPEVKKTAEEVKAPVVKPAEQKAPVQKTPETPKPQEVKAPEQKPTEVKQPIAKVPEVKAPEPKVVEAKPAEKPTPVAEPAEVKIEPKPTEVKAEKPAPAKAPEPVKTQEPKAPEPKLPEIKQNKEADKKVVESKIPKPIEQPLVKKVPTFEKTTNQPQKTVLDEFKAEKKIALEKDIQHLIQKTNKLVSEDTIEDLAVVDNLARLRTKIESLKERTNQIQIATNSVTKVSEEFIFPEKKVEQETVATVETVEPAVEPVKQPAVKPGKKVPADLKINIKDEKVTQAKTTTTTKQAEQPGQGGGSNDQQDNNAQNQQAPEQPSQQQPSQGSPSGGSGSGGDGDKSPPLSPTKLPDFFDPPPPPIYNTSIEVHVQREKPPQVHPKITKKLIAHTDALDRKTELFLQGIYTEEDRDLSLASAHRKVKSIKHALDHSTSKADYTEDTYEKAILGDFDSILTPAQQKEPKGPVFEYQYTIEDPETGACISTTDASKLEEIQQELVESRMSEYSTTRRTSSSFKSSSTTKKVEGIVC
jgi:hypothetical protein